MFGQQVDALASAITEQVKAAYMGDAAIGSALYAKDEGQSSRRSRNCSRIRR